MEPNLVNEHVLPAQRRQGYNFGTANIAHASVVCRDLEQSVGGDVLQTARRQVLGVKYPTAANIGRIAGIYSANDRKPLYAAGAGEVVEQGLVLARVYVPADVSLAAGTHLVVGSEWNATDDDVDFIKTISATPYSGVLEPLVWATDDDEETRATVYPAANPLAILREALTAGGAATIQTALVEVLPHAPMPFNLLLGLDVPATLSRCILRARGPGVVTGVFAHILTGGTTQGGTLIDLKIQPVGEWNGTPESKSVFQSGKTIFIPHDVSDDHAPVFGCGCDLVGDIDPDDDDSGLDWGTSELQGLLEAAETARQFPALAMLTLDLTVDATSPANLVVGVEGLWY